MHDHSNKKFKNVVEKSSSSTTQMLQPNENANDSSASSRSRLENDIDEEFLNSISDIADIVIL